MTLWVGTSWKMNKLRGEARQYAQQLKSASTHGWPGVQPFIVPPATSLALVSDILVDSPVRVGAQNAHWEDAGPWTGEVSVPQVKDAGATVVEIGHSERREFFGETDETVNRKVLATLTHGLTPLVCFGEPLDVFSNGGSIAYVMRQVEKALEGVSDLSEVLLAYEPIWAIGENGRPARPEDIAPVIASLSQEWGNKVKGLLYGGSVSVENAKGLLEIPGVGGLFIGRSAWQVDGYIEILNIASAHSR